MTLEERLEPYKELENIELRVKGSYDLKNVEQGLFDIPSEEVVDSNKNLFYSSDGRTRPFIDATLIYSSIFGLYAMAISFAGLFWKFSSENFDIPDSGFSIEELLTVSLVSFGVFSFGILGVKLYDSYEKSRKDKTKEQNMKKLSELDTEWSGIKTSYRKSCYDLRDSLSEGKNIATDIYSLERAIFDIYSFRVPDNFPSKERNKLEASKKTIKSDVLSLLSYLRDYSDQRPDYLSDISRFQDFAKKIALDNKQMSVYDAKIKELHQEYGS